MTNIDLSINYIGIELRNPFIVSSSGLSASVDKIMMCEEKGAGAVVLKSIFEEQMAQRAANTIGFDDYPEAADYITNYTMQNTLNNYIELIRNAKNKCNLPIIASINCYNTDGRWIEFTKQIEGAGADAIELNIFIVPTVAGITGGEIERKYLEITAKVAENTQIPISIKIPSNLTSTVNIAQELGFRGAKGVTMFNRTYNTNIDIEKMEVCEGEVINQNGLKPEMLRQIAIVSCQTPQIDIAASGGIQSTEDAIKAMLAGAKAVMLCSTLYRNGVEGLSVFVRELRDWMHRKGFSSVNDFTGALNYKKSENANLYERVQFMRYFSSNKR